MRSFSLLELVLIMAIVATLAAIAVPRYGTALDRYHADAAAHRIIRDLELARATARAEGKTVTLTFNVAQDRYVLSGVDDLENSGSDAEVILTDEPYRSRVNSALFSGDTKVIFDGYGAPDSGGTVVVSCGAITRSVMLDQDLGVATLP
jgi:Tfp pilus assembly protein FimT